MFKKKTDPRQRKTKSSWLTPRPSNSRGMGGQRPYKSNSRSSRRPRFSEAIDYSKFIQKADTSSPEKTIVITNSFEDFGFCDEIKKNLSQRKFVTPTPIQDKTINHVLKDKDIIGLANTGTGKTGAFLLPLIEKVFTKKYEKVLIIAPTRELALQIDTEFRQFAWSMKIFSATCVGGAPIFKQINNLKRNPGFVIGTPGRLKDLSDRGLIKFNQFKYIVLDEVDRMLDMGFVEEIRAILDQLPENHQSLFFSATMPPKIQSLVNKFLKDPITVDVVTGQTAKNVDQDIVRVRDKAIKFNQLTDLLNNPEFKKILIFSETKIDVERLTRDLVSSGFKASSIHGDKKQSERQRALRAFKNDDFNILVATDVAARGLDIKDISHVINYTVPQTYDDYVHRIGRTGRAGQKGYALTFVE